MSTCNYHVTPINLDASSICCTSRFLVALLFLVPGVTWWRCYFSYEVVLGGTVIYRTRSFLVALVFAVQALSVASKVSWHSERSIIGWANVT